jgi:hypothetical protein
MQMSLGPYATNSSFPSVSVRSHVALAHSLCFLPQIGEIICLVRMFQNLLSPDSDRCGHTPDTYREKRINESSILVNARTIS